MGIHRGGGHKMKRLLLYIFFIISLAATAHAQTYTQTPNLDLYKPTAPPGSWGDLINQNFDTLDALYPPNTAPGIIVSTCPGTDRVSGITAAGALICATTGSGGGGSLGAGLAAFDALTSAADSLPYWTGPGTAAIATFTAHGRTLVAGANAAATRTSIGTVIGTDVQAQNAKLASIAASAPGNGGIYIWNGSALITTSFPDCPNTTTNRLNFTLSTWAFTCGSSSAGTLSPGLLAVDGLSPVADRVAYYTGATTAALATFTAHGRVLAASASASDTRTAIGSIIGTDVQAFHAKLASISASSPANGGMYVWNGSALIASTLPNCTDTLGQHLNFTLASWTWSCGTSGGGGGGLTGGVSGFLLKYDSATSAVPSGLQEDTDSFNFTKTAEFCPTTCFFGMDPSIFSGSLKTWSFRVNQSDVFVGEGSAQTLTNKVLNATNNTITNITGAMMTAATVTPTQLSAAPKVKVCEIAVGDPGAATAVLADDNDSPGVCGNRTGQTITITAVHCYAPVGSPTVRPIVTAGAADSILTGALTCTSAAGGAAGTLNGTPTQGNGVTVDGNITTAGGAAKYLVIRISYTL
jgi:hypothetical protein